MFKKLLPLGICLLLVGCGNSEEITQVEEPEDLEEISITVKCNPNLLLSKYDVQILVDGENIGVIEHGEKDTFTIDLPKGKHTIGFEKEDDSSVDGSKSFNVKEKTALKYIVSCKNDQIEVETIKRIKPPVTNDDLEGLKVEEVKEKFVEAGFSNIETVAEKELSIEEKDKNNNIKNIKIGKKNKFTSSDDFFEDTKVTISYFALKDIEMPNSEYFYEDKDVSEVEQMLRDLGFSNFEYEEFETYTESEDNTVGGVRIDGYHFEKGDSFSPDATVTISKNWYDYTREHFSLSDLAGNTHTVFENYGESLYPYGFKCHWRLDLRNEEEMSDGTTFIKVGVTITNAFGEDYYAVAEGTVSGNTVTGFWVNPE
ncbi:hypothetical protein H5983_06015 [Faecalitalea cylindroides]|uniref:hypothetical protein n=1 Tax=Faecalitalea cylindroides TaxID=39483 RepID=UPI00195CC96C|nr:hypothetical protein [Faecalitalea cylindroides]MBM6810618.1 hypothetical protein [Faecalitalea cylindroides]